MYTTYEYFKILATEKMTVALVAKGNKLMTRAVPGARLFVPETIYNQRKINLLKNVTFIAKYDVRLILGFNFDEKSIYEFRLENEIVNMTIWDFSLPFFRIKEEVYILTNLDFFVKVFHQNTKKKSNLQKTGRNILCSGLIT